jgi:hypothetical protein
MSVLLNSLKILIFIFNSYCLYAQMTICGNQYMLNDSISKVKIIEADRVIAQYLTNSTTNSRSEIIIPVVVHIVWHDLDEYLSDAIVLSQIETINKDFNAENDNIQGVADEFKSVIGNAGIRFCLAAIDPNGKATTGIVRTKTDKPEIGLSDDLYFSANGGSDAWNTDKYLNIWVANTGNLLSGLGSYPNQTLPEKTGVIIHPKYFGVNGHSKYGLGRVATHEIGHYLGLKHLWADDTDCNTDDDVIDTPPQKEAYVDCPSFPQDGCSESEMFMNFMDYVDDPCMAMFTQGQCDRMLATINTYRSGFIGNNVSCLTARNLAYNPLLIYPNPSSDLFICSYAIAPMQMVRYSLYNAIGQFIKAEEKLVNRNFYIDLQSFPSGLYFLFIENEVYKIAKK